LAQQDLLTYTIQALDRAGIDYMVTGSIVSSLQGEPRSTHDLDLVVAVQPEHVLALLSAFPAPHFYVDEAAVVEAIEVRGVFNVIDRREGDKVDFWMLRDDDFDRSRFGRRYEEEVFGIRIKVSSPEDTILAKLRWAKLSGGGDRYVRDALGVYEVQRDSLNLSYLEDWASRLGVVDLLQRVRDEADVP
jgi:hypothetical protein